MTEAPPKATVVIPAKDAAGTLRPCLEALRAQGVPGPETELIVVDDASRDETGAIAAEFGARVLRGAGRGPAAARNLAAREARGETLVFLDADTVPADCWLEEMLAPLADPEIVAVKGRYYSSQPELVARFTQLEFEEKYSRLERARQVDFVDSGTAAFRRAPFLAAGGFDEDFPAQSAEDVELAFRLSAQGAKFAFNPRAGVQHRHAGTLAQYLVKKARYGFFRVRVYRRYPQKAMGDSYTPPTMGVQIGLAGLSGILGFLALVRVPGARLGLAAVLAAFGITTRTLVQRAGATDASLVPWVPPLIFARAWAQGTGIALALALLLAERLRLRGS